VLDRQPRSTQRLGSLEIETEEVTAVVGNQGVILTPVEMSSYHCGWVPLTVLQDCQVMRRMTSVIASPMTAERD
jgi:hypothetical protein